MKQRDSILKRKIEELICKIEKQWGHKHLYTDYQVLVDTLETNNNLSKEETYALKRLVEILSDETKRYFRSYPKWSSRCLECASELIFFLSNDGEKEKKVKSLMGMWTLSVTDPNLSVFVHMGNYRQFIEDVAKNNVGILGQTAFDCFITASSGRRPWGIKDEISFHKQMVEGFELATKYISLTGDFSHFPDWFSTLNPCRTDSLIEEVSNWIDRNEDVQNLRWEHYSYEDVVEYLEDTLDKQLSLLWKWLDGDVEGFVNHWGAKRIEDLLELFVEDDVLFDVLRKLASLKHNQTVADILTFYAEYDLPSINSNALKLLEEYRL